MEKEIFVALIENLKAQYEKQRNFTTKLEELFGSDTVIFIDVLSDNIEDQLKILSKAIGDKDESWVDWLFWESLNSPGEMGISTFTVNDEEYPGTPGNIWEAVHGNLD